jgi:transketolase
VKRSAETISTRDAYGKALVELGESDSRIVALDADLASSTRTGKFGERFPERFFNLGVAEQNLYAVAAGLATCGKIAFASTYAVFAAERALNQIKQCIAYPALNVKIAVTHSGFSASGDGASHQALTDIAIMRSLPNMAIVVPADAVQTEKAVRAAAEWDGPVYLRLGKIDVPTLFEQDVAFRIGRAVVARQGQDATVLVTGILLGHALRAAEIVEGEGLDVEVIHVHTIKPIDAELLVESARKTRCVLTVEDHSIIGGLGGAAAEVYARYFPVGITMIGIEDVFGESGEVDQLYERHGLIAEQIVQRIRLAVKNKSSNTGVGKNERA